MMSCPYCPKSFSILTYRGHNAKDRTQIVLKDGEPEKVKTEKRLRKQTECEEGFCEEIRLRTRQATGVEGQLPAPRGV
jgi:hypothetical protein